MKTLPMFACVLLLTGCASDLAQRDAEDACKYMKANTERYAECFANAYSDSANRRQSGANVAGSGLQNLGQSLLTQPTRPVYYPPQTQVCRTNPYNNQIYCY